MLGWFVRTIAVIQARMGSTRLPGKMMLPLRDEHVLTHDIHRVSAARLIDDVCVATSTKKSDEIIARYTRRAGATAFRGSESDVLSRVYNAALDASADIVVRVTGDCPLIHPETIDTVIKPILEQDVDYASNILERTFPRGLDVEAFTFESFKKVQQEATEARHREHVTPYYHEKSGLFEIANITSEEVFEDPKFQNRDDLRLTLDEADDYEVLREIYENIPFSNILPVRDAIRYADENDLMKINEEVRQKSH